LLAALRSDVSRVIGLCLSTVVAFGCAPVSDPGYAVSFRNESDRSLIVRGDRYAGAHDPSQWVLPPHSAGRVLMTLGEPREAPPIDYDIVDESSCRIVGVQLVDFALAPNPGFAEFVVVIGPDTRIRLETGTTPDQPIDRTLSTTSACPAA
jgi:hypothetical protein